MACAAPQLSPVVAVTARPQELSIGPHPIPHPHSVAVSVSSPLGFSVSHDSSFAVYAKLWAKGRDAAGGRPEGTGRGKPGGGGSRWRAQRKSTSR